MASTAHPALRLPACPRFELFDDEDFYGAGDSKRGGGPQGSTGRTQGQVRGEGGSLGLWSTGGCKSAGGMPPPPMPSPVYAPGHDQAALGPLPCLGCHQEHEEEEEQQQSKRQQGQGQGLGQGIVAASALLHLQVTLGTGQDGTTDHKPCWCWATRATWQRTLWR